MDRIVDIRRIDMLCIGQMFKLKLFRYGEAPEDISFITTTDDGKTKLQALKEFIEVFHLENKSFLIDFN